MERNARGGTAQVVRANQGVAGPPLALPAQLAQLDSLQVREVFHVQFEQARAGVHNALHRVSTGTNGVANVHAKSHPAVHALNRVQHRLRRWEMLVFGTVVVNRDADVVFAD